MSLKKRITIVFLVLGIFCVFMAEVFAAESWYTCTVNRIGGYTKPDGAIQVRLTDTKGTFSNVYFKISENRLNQILAVFLAAATNGSTVYVKADPVKKSLSAAFYNVE